MKKKIKKIGYELADISIVQAKVSDIGSRSNTNPYVDICGRGSLPLFVAPMATVVDANNYRKFIENNVTPVVPRSAFDKTIDDFKKRIIMSLETFVSFSMSEMEDVTNKDSQEYIEMLYRADLYGRCKSVYNKMHICIDIAHGTLKRLFRICRKLKSLFGDAVVIMTGNIANPEAYEECCKNGIDWVRCSIGTGSRCTTSCNTAVHYPMATLLDEIRIVRNRIERKAKFKNLFRKKKMTITKVIADGGIKNFDDIAKSLVLGADAVMCGKLFNECEEAAYPAYFAANEMEFIEGDRYTSTDNPKLKKYREYFGMSTHIAKPLIGTTSDYSQEGISYPTEVKYTLKEFTKMVKDYLRSSMSYTNCGTIDEFRKNCEVIVNASGDLQYRK